MIVFHRRLVPRARRTARVSESLRLSVRLSDELATRYLLGPEFEPETVWLLTAFLRTGDVVLDVGANIGHMTIIAAQKTGPTGRVFAFEPSPAEFRELKHNIRLNGLENVEPLLFAVTDAHGTIPFHLAGKGLGLYNSVGLPFRSLGVRAIEVSATTLDGFVEDRLLTKVDLVKMDIEGGELTAIRGGRALFSRADAPLFTCEFSDLASTATGQTSAQLWALFEEMGYALYEFERPGRKRLRRAVRCGHYDYENLVGVKPHHLKRLRECGLL